jgi:hypothetical protein
MPPSGRYHAHFKIDLYNLTCQRKFLVHHCKRTR